AAAENFAHFLQTTFSKKTDNWFASQGVDLQGSLLEHQQNGMGVSEAMTHIVQMQLEKMNPAILGTFKRTMQIEDLSARSNALQSMEIAKAATATRESAETWANAALATHDR
ncbi:phage tail tape measure protein, partial [Escherichia coli]